MKTLFRIFICCIALSAPAMVLGNNTLPNPFDTPKTPDNTSARSLEDINGKSPTIPSPDSMNDEINTTQAARQAQALKQQQQAVKDNKQRLAQQQITSAPSANNSSSSTSTQTNTTTAQTASTDNTNNSQATPLNNTDADSSNSSSSSAQSSHNDNSWGIQY